MIWLLTKLEKKWYEDDTSLASESSISIINKGGLAHRDNHTPLIFWFLHFVTKEKQ